MTKEHKEFITLRANGETFDSIAQKLNKAKSTLYYMAMDKNTAQNELQGVL